MAPDMRPELLLTDATVLTVSDRMPRAAWVAVDRGRVVAVGDSADDAPRARRVVSLGGATLVPGFHDAHNHTVHYGQSLGAVDLRSPGVSTLQELYRLVGEAAARQPEGSWVIGENYDQNKLGGHPDLAELDRVAPRHLVRLGHNSRHMCFVNSAVLERVGAREAADPQGGRIDRLDDGRPSGLLLESAMELLRPLLWPVPLERMVEAIGAAHEQYVAQGITAVQEAGIGAGLAGASPIEGYAYQVARESGRVRVRTTLMPAAAGAEPLDGASGDDAFGYGLGMRSGFGDLWLRIGPLKVFSDGSLIGRSAAMSEGYVGEPCNHGLLAMPPEQLQRTIMAAHASGWQVAAHAIGDAAVDEVLTAYEQCLTASPRRDHRHRIEHAGVVTDAALARMAALGVIPSPQGRFIGELGDGIIDALGRERLGQCYRGRSFLDAGLELPGSSDRPVVDGAPLLGIHDMVNRRTDSGREFSPQEGLTPQQALRAYTRGSAHAAFLDGEMGSIEAGRLADFAVLSDDLTRMDPERIREVLVLATIIGGRAVHDPSGLVGEGDSGAPDTP
jgi:predicted amidohydrolase YtcJ